MNRLSIAFIFLSFVISLAAQEKTVRMEAISMRDCLLRAIRYNLEIESEAYNTELSDFDLMLARSEFDPAFVSSFSYGKTEQLQSSIFRPSAIIQSNFDIQLQKKHFLGGTISLGYDMSFTDQQGNEPFVELNPQWEHTVTLKVTQPLLKNLGIDFNDISIKQAQIQINSSYYQFYHKLLEVLANVQLAYWDLVNARQNYQLQQKSLELAKNLYEIQLERNRVGALARADILEAERNVAFKRDSLVVAEQSIYASEDQLKQLIRPLDLDYYQNVRLIPTERLDFKEIDPNFDEALKYAIEHRADLAQSGLGIENFTLEIERQKNQLLPNLDINASIGYDGLGGGSSSAWKPVRNLDFPAWQLGITLQIPLGNRAARSRYKKALIQRQQSESNYRQLESLVILELRQAVRDLITAMRRVETARITRTLAEKQLLNEENKFRAGLIALFQVQDTEQKLTEARIQETTSLVDYHRAIVKLYKAKGALLDNLAHYQITLDVPDAASAVLK